MSPNEVDAEDREYFCPPRLASQREARAVQELAVRTMQRDAALAWARRERRRGTILAWCAVGMGVVTALSMTVNVFHDFWGWLR